MARHPVPTFDDLWKQHEALYTNMFHLALDLLSKKPTNTANEDAISEKLCPALTEVCFRQSQVNNREIPTPDWEKPIQPVIENELRGGRIRKRPDFTCKRINPFALLASEHEVPFHVECKRLGNRASATWILNQNYVTHGISRFDCPFHEYGKRARSGMMIGYIVSMTPEAILAEVNAYQRLHLPQHNNIRFKFGRQSVHHSRQKISRLNILPEEFELIHLWVKLRAEGNANR